MSQIIARFVRRLPAKVVRVPLDVAATLPRRLKIMLPKTPRAQVSESHELRAGETLSESSNLEECDFTLRVAPLYQAKAIATSAAVSVAELDDNSPETQSSIGHSCNVWSESPEPLTPSALRYASLAESISATLRARHQDGERRAMICGLRLESGQLLTLEEIAGRFGLTRERVRQIVAKSLKSLKHWPVGIAVEHRLSAILDEVELARPADLARCDPWFESLSPHGLWILVEALAPSLAIRPPRGGRYFSRHSEAVVLTMLERVRTRLAAVSNPDRAREVARLIAHQEAYAAQLPRAAETLAAIAEDQLQTRTLTFSAFVADFVAKQTSVFDIAAVRAAATKRGFCVSENMARNTVATIPGVYPLGRSTFATLQAMFPLPDPLRDDACAFAEVIINNSPQRQFHSEELFDEVRIQLGRAHAAAVVDKQHLTALLIERRKVRPLGRMVFVSLHSSLKERLNLVALAFNVLQDARHPLNADELLARMQAHRGVAKHSVQAVLESLRQVGPGRYWLPDIPVPTAPVSIYEDELLEDAFAALIPGETISIAELKRRIAQRSGNDAAFLLETSYLRRMLGNDSRFVIGQGGRAALAGAASRSNPFDTTEGEDGRSSIGLVS